MQVLSLYGLQTFDVVLKLSIGDYIGDEIEVKHRLILILWACGERKA